ncbi:MAG: ATP-binding protein [Clostridia bacterium]|nr:ATP-binding protein [Clostridia bacterium]
MSNFLNLGNGKFQIALNSKIYVDKTGLIEYTNELISTEQRFLCVSRPRRFGKSMAANMLGAYYCRGCDSHAQFDGLEISKSPDYEKHINKYNVIYVDVSGYLKSCAFDATVSSVLSDLRDTIISNIQEEYPGMIPTGTVKFPDYLDMVYRKTGIPFVFIIDEWDAIFRNRKDDFAGQREYLNWLESLLKGREYVALAYMTGILPIKKYCTNSSLNMFMEFSVLKPGNVKTYFGFTEDEVRKLCEKFGRSFDDIKTWYDGYVFKGEPEDLHIYNSNSVVRSLEDNELGSYWSDTESYEDLEQYIKTDMDGLHGVIQSLMEGGTYYFINNAPSNDIVSISNRDDVLTILIHLGYLAYNTRTGLVTIPNREILAEFVDTVRKMGDSPLSLLMRDSKELFDSTKEKNEEKVSELIKKIHREHSSVRKYKDEGTLSTIVRFAYVYALSLYKMRPEAESGDGYADLVLSPLSRGKDLPMIIELKAGKTADEAIAQIKRMNYVDRFREEGYKGDVLLVGINYKTSKMLPRSRGVFTCKIVSETL